MRPFKASSYYLIDDMGETAAEGMHGEPHHVVEASVNSRHKLHTYTYIYYVLHTHTHTHTHTHIKDALMPDPNHSP